MSPNFCTPPVSLEHLPIFGMQKEAEKKRGRKLLRGRESSRVESVSQSGETELGVQDQQSNQVWGERARSWDAARYKRLNPTLSDFF